MAVTFDKLLGKPLLHTHVEADLGGPYVNTTGDTMTGALTITPTSNALSILEVQQADNSVVLSVDTTNARVGIGTVSPGELLDVAGNVTITSSGKLGVGLAPGNTGSVIAAAGRIFAKGDDNGLLLLYDSSNNLVLQANTNSRAFGINGIGNATLGVYGVGTAGHHLMEAYDSSSVLITRLRTTGIQEWYLGSAGAILYTTPATSPGIAIFTGATWDQNQFTFANEGGQFRMGYEAYSSATTAGEQFVILNTGGVVFNEGGDAGGDLRAEGGTDANLLFVDAGTDRVGIGTTGPTSKLHVKDAINNMYVNIETDKVNGIAGIKFENDARIWQINAPHGGSGDAFTIQDVTANVHPFVIEAGTPVATLHLDSTGNVGIGTTGPAVKLEVSGTTTGHVRVTSTQADSNSTFQLKNDGIYQATLQFNGSTAAGLAGANSLNLVNQYNAPLAFYTNNTERVRILAGGNVGIGIANPSQQLEITAAFEMPGTTSSTTGVIYKGTDRFIHDFKAAGTVGYNTFIGIGSGNFTMYTRSPVYEASYNTGLGYATLSGLTYGRSNMAIGYSSLTKVTTGQDNVAIGQSTLRFNVTGSFNTVVGSNAGQGVINNSHSNNTFVGYASGLVVTTGSNNVCLGYQSGNNLTTGSNNIVIGYDIDSPTATNSNTMTIGNLIFATGLTATGTTISTGNVGIGVTDPDTKLEVFNAGNQLKLSFDGTDNAIFAVDTNGDLTITPSGSNFIIPDAKNIVLNTTTGTKIGTATTQKLGFFNATPVVQPSAYTPTNVTTDRTYDANSTTLDEVADILGTLIADLQSLGLIG